MSGLDAQLRQPFDAGFFRLVELLQQVLEIPALLSQLLPGALDLVDHPAELSQILRQRVINGQKLARFLDREPDLARPQYPPHHVPVGLRVEPGPPSPRRLYQSLVLVESQGARRNPERARKLGNG